jgi:uncharacterized protein
MANNWKSKRVLIAGGSSGLGLAMARCLAGRGAHLILVARNEARLTDAAKTVRELGCASVDTICADACDEQSIRVGLAQFSSGERAVDLVVNAVGQSDRGQLLQLESTELVDMFRTNAMSAFHIAKYCRPALRNSSGSIVLIGSLATRLAPAGLGGYAISKFPLAAMRQQLSFELALEGIHVMLVCPGPIQRDDAGTRYQECIVERGLSEGVSKPGGGARVKALDPDWLCQRILRGVERREREIIVPWKAKIAVIIGSISTRIGDWLLKKSMSQ